MFENKSIFTKRNVTVLFFLSYSALIFFIFFILKFNLFRSDIVSYWEDSLNWKTPFNEWHVPGYPLLIAFVRIFTNNLLSPLALMMVINLIAFVISLFCLYKIFLIIGFSEEISLFGICLFGLWPFTGLLYGVYPLADTPAIMIFLAAIYLMLSNQRIGGFTLLGLAIIFQKILWPFVFCYVLFDFLGSRKVFSKKQWFVYLTLLISPLFILWIGGSIYHNNLLWMVNNHLAVDVSSEINVPLLGTIIGVFSQKGIIGVLKGFLILVVVIIAIFNLVCAIKRKPNFNYLIISISMAILIAVSVVMPRESWSIIRYSKLLVLPALISISDLLDFSVLLKKHNFIIITLLLLMLSSQFIYGYYMTIYFS